MNITVILMSAIFLLVGLLVNRRNAKFLISGFNTASDEKRKPFNPNHTLLFLKKFHIFLGISLLGAGLFLNWRYGEIQTGIFLGIYPLLAYLTFIFKSREFVSGTQKKMWVVTGIFLGLALVIIGGIFVTGLRESKLLIHSDSLEITGLYGEITWSADIRSLKLVRHLPEIISKTNGFDLGNIEKGYFKTRPGKTVKLILNSDRKPLIDLTKSDGKEIYYSARSRSNIQIYNEIILAIPDIPRIP